jgi:hypothetical protein
MSATTSVKATATILSECEMHEILVASITQIVVAMITLLGVTITALYAVSSHKHAKEINEAVNRRHTKKNKDGEVPPHMFDLVIDTHDQVLKMEPKVESLHEWRNGYKDNPMANTKEIVKFVEDMDDLTKFVKGLECHAKPCDDPSCSKKNKDPE